MARTKLTLQDVARAASERNGGKGGRALQRMARDKGLTLSFTTVDRIMNGKYESTPQKQTIEALAVLAEMPLEDVYEAAGIPLPMAPFADQLPEGSDQLAVHQRRVVLDVIRGFIRDNRKIDDLEAELERAPLHPYKILESAASIDVRELDDNELDWWFEKVTLMDQGDEDTLRKIHEFSRSLELEMRRRVRSGGGAVEDPSQPDGITPEPENTAKRPLPENMFGLAASRGPRGRAEIDRRAAETGEESQDPEG